MNSFREIRRIALLASVAIPLAYTTTGVSVQEKPKGHGDTPAGAYQLIKDPRLITPTGKYNVFNKRQDVH